MKFRISPLFSFFLLSVLLFLIQPVWAKVFFHSNLEQGETYLQEEIKSGAKKIKLVQNHRLAEWPLGGGQGMIEGNLPSAMDTFNYKIRKRNVLAGVSGIKRHHPQGVSVCTGNLGEWDLDKFAAGHWPDVSAQPSFFGNYAAKFPGSINQLLAGEIPHGLIKLYFRFYACFDKKFLENDTIEFAIFVADYKNMQLAATRVRKEKKGTFFALDHISESQIKSFRNEVFPDKRIYILPDAKYCVEIEYDFAFQDTFSSLAHLRVNGIEQMTRFWKFRRDYNLISNYLDNFHIGKLTAGPIKGNFWVDEIIVSDSASGSIPSRPEIVFQNGTLCSSPISDMIDGKNKHIQSQWQVNGVNSWIIPLVNSGENKNNLLSFNPFYIKLSDSINNAPTVVSDTLFIPTGIEANKEYLARGRHQNAYGNWSDWSIPTKFTPAQADLQNIRFTPDCPMIQKAFFAEVGRQKPLAKIQKDKWYDFYLYVFDPDKKGFANLGYTDMWLEYDPENSLSNYANRGRAFSSYGNYIISISFGGKDAYAKENQGANLWTPLSTKPLGLYADARKIEFNEKQGWIKIKIRLLKDCFTGIFSIRGYVTNLQKGKLSPIYGSVFYVTEFSSPNGPITKNRMAIASFLFILLAAGFGTYLHSRRKRIKKSVNEKSPAGLSTDSEIVPLVFNSPYDENIKKAKDFIIANYHRNISPKDVGRVINVSLTWLSVFFHRGTGKTVIQYINEVRIEHAKKLLADTKLNISEIAFKTGFRSQDHFYKIFAKFEKKSPKEYRESRNQ